MTIETKEESPDLPAAGVDAAEAVDPYYEKIMTRKKRVKRKSGYLWEKYSQNKTSTSNGDIVVSLEKIAPDMQNEELDDIYLEKIKSNQRALSWRAREPGDLWKDYLSEPENLKVLKQIKISAYNIMKQQPLDPLILEEYDQKESETQASSSESKGPKSTHFEYILKLAEAQQKFDTPKNVYFDDLYRFNVHELNALISKERDQKNAAKESETRASSSASKPQGFEITGLAQEEQSAAKESETRASSSASFVADDDRQVLEEYVNAAPYRIMQFKEGKDFFEQANRTRDKARKAIQKVIKRLIDEELINPLPVQKGYDAYRKLLEKFNGLEDPIYIDYFIACVCAKLERNIVRMDAKIPCIAYKIFRLVLPSKPRHQKLLTQVLGCLNDMCNFTIDGKAGDRTVNGDLVAGILDRSQFDPEKCRNTMEFYGSFTAAKILKTHLDGTSEILPHPHGIKFAWSWLARFLNHAPKLLSNPASGRPFGLILRSFLNSNAGYELWKLFPKQFHKICRAVQDNLLQGSYRDDNTKLDQGWHCSASSVPAIRELAVYTEEEQCEERTKLMKYKQDLNSLVREINLYLQSGEWQMPKGHIDNIEASENKNDSLK